MIYYNQDKILVRDSTKIDADYIAKYMRKSDIEEIWASHNHKPEDAMKLALDNSLRSFTIMNGNPIAMFGICPQTFLGDSASIWLLATDGIDKIRRRVARNSILFIGFLLSFYPYLDNYVDVRNTQSIKWLKLCGAKFDEPAPFGCEGLMFQHFSFQRSE